VSEAGGRITVQVTDSFRRRVYLAPYGLYLTLDAGRFQRVEIDPATGAVSVTLAPATGSTPRAYLRVEQPAQLPGAGDYAPVSSFESERGAFVVPLGSSATVGALRASAGR
jgi:hypothetical protein